MRRRPYLAVPALLASLALLIAACGAEEPGSSNSAQDMSAAGTEESATVRVGGIPFAQYIAGFYAGEPEIEDDVNLNIEVSSFPRAVDAVEALRAGQVDVTFGGIGSFLPSYVEGLPMYLVGSVGYGGYRFLRQPGSDINGYEDLEGKRIGLTRGALEVLWSAVLSDAGLTGSDVEGEGDVTMIFLPGVADMSQALARGDVDAIIQSEPIASEAIDEGIGEEVSKPYDTSAGPITKVIMMSAELYDEQPDVAQRYVDAFVAATMHLCENPDERFEYTRDVVFEGLLEEGDYERATDNAPVDVASLTIEEVQTNADLLYENGQLSEQVDAEEAVKLDLIESAAERLGWTSCDG